MFIRELPLVALKPLVKALLSRLPEDPSSAIITVKSDGASAVQTSNAQPLSDILDPANIFVLELSTVLSLRDRETLENLGGEVSEALQNIMRDASSYHPTTVSRAVFYLLKLLNVSYVSVSLHLFILNI